MKEDKKGSLLLGLGAMLAVVIIVALVGVFALKEEEVLITGETTGVYECTVHAMHDAKGKLTERVEKGQFFAIKTDRLIRRGDKLFLWEKA